MPTLYDWAGSEEAFGCLTAVLVIALALSACGGDDDKSSAQSSATPRCTPAPGTSTAMSIEPGWSKGDARSIRISKTRDESGQDASESSTTADLRVLEAGEKGSRLEWRSTDLVLPDDQLPDDAKGRMKDAAKGFEVIYGTDSRGAYEAKQNVPEIRDRLTNVLDRLEEDPEQAEAVSRTRQIILSDAFIQASVVKEIPLLHGAYGLKLQEGKPQAVNREIPSPFGGAALRARGTVELVEARDGGGCAVVELDVRPNRDDLATSLVDTFGDQAKDAPAAAKRAGLSLHNTGRFTYDPGTGWFVRVDTTQSVKIGGKSRSEVTVITTRG